MWEYVVCDASLLLKWVQRIFSIYLQCFTQALYSCALWIFSNMLLTSKLCYQFETWQPYPQLHQSLIPVQNKLSFSFPSSPFWKAQWLEVDLKSTIANLFPTGPSWIPKASASLSASGDQAISLSSLQTGSPVCLVAFGVISLAVDRSSKRSAVITGSLRWRQGRGPLKKGTEAKTERNVAECEESFCSYVGRASSSDEICADDARRTWLRQRTWWLVFMLREIRYFHTLYRLDNCSNEVKQSMDKSIIKKIITSTEWVQT